MNSQQDLRLTPQRRAVLEVLRAAHDHPTAAEVYDRVRVVAPGIGAATVYRALGLLVRAGFALELSLGNGAAARYDANVGRHDHAVCDRCGRAVDIDLPVPVEMVAALSRHTGFAITGYDLQFRGLCPSCQTAGPTVAGPTVIGPT
ncbi:Fur family transcriptional regulator [Frankia sp. Cas3]|uniref:Fur family transcriptional regulator n=1 Tax=Frankia sp. Cas3 TaxID=3073926 RepID=UPI002AD508C0|nr:Fur family transcriptional regulator [Frankia sp. Cas3]